jgi:hypothetical protein
MAFAAVQNYFLFLNWDIAWLTQCTNQLLHGGKYYTDFFETNPTMILYLYMPPVIFSSLFHISIITVFKAYIFLVCFLLLFICYLLLGKVFRPEKQGIKNFLALIMAFLFFIFPSYSFGQREHLATMLVLPYLLLVVLRAERKPISLGWCFIAGVFGGIGFSIKPHFIIVFAMFEIYLMLKKKDYLSRLRPEMLCVIFIVVLYLCSIFIFTPEYIFKIIPLTSSLYFGALLNIGWPVIFCCWATLVVLISLGIYLAQREKLYYIALADVLAIASLGFYFVYLLQHAFWFYHQLPAFSFGILLSALVIFESCRFARGFGLISVMFFALCLLAVTFFSLYENDNFSRWFMAEKIQPMVKLIQQTQIKGPVYVFSSVVPDTYPWVLYAKIQSASRWPSFIFLAKLAQQPMSVKTGKEAEKLLKEKKEIIQMVIEDFKKNQPSLVIVDKRKEMPYFDASFDYLSFFSSALQFKKIWGNYKYLKSYNDYDLYRKQ